MLDFPAAHLGLPEMDFGGTTLGLQSGIAVLNLATVAESEEHAVEPTLSLFLLFTFVQNLSAQVTPPATNASESVHERIAALKTGQVVTLTLLSGKKVQGSVLGKTDTAIELRHKRAFFRTRAATYPTADIVSVKKDMPGWVLPVVVLGAVGGLCVGVVACVASGACLN